MIDFIDWQLLSQQWLLTLIHFLWQAAIIGVVLSIMLRLFAKTSARLRYSISCAALFSLPVLALVTFAWVNSNSQQSVWLKANSLEDFAAESVCEPTTDFPLNAISSALPAQLEMSVVCDSNQSIQAEPTNSEAQAKPTPSLSLQWQAFLTEWSSWLTTAYCIGVLFIFGRLGVAIWGSQRLRTAIQPITDSVLLEAIAKQAKRLGLRGVPIAGICERVSVPMVVGLLKPTILLPPALLCGLEPQQLSLIIAHELAHIRRYDLLVNLGQRLVEALLFFHPVTWWISHRVRIEREKCCDDIAAGDADQLTYAASLLRMAELCVGSNSKKSASLAAMSADGGNATELASRIRRLIDTEDSPRIGLSKSGLRWLTIAL